MDYGYDDYDDEFDEFDFGDIDFDQERTLQSNVQKTAQNLKVTVVPDITMNAGLNGETFDAKLTADVQLWFDNLKKTWNAYKKGAIITNIYNQFYLSRTNPFEDALKLYANCSDIDSSKKNSISYAVIEELNRFKQNNCLNTNGLLDDNLRMVALNFAKTSGQQSRLKLIVNTFELVGHNHLFIDRIKDLIGQHNYKDACHIATELQLYTQFTIYDFVLPLILQDKLCSAEMYMEHAVHLQRSLIQVLDSLLDRSTSVHNVCDSYIALYDYRDIAYHKLQTKIITKLVKRLAKIYNLLNADAMPNTLKAQAYGQLQFLLHKNYNERGLSKESWREMVREIIPKTSNIELKLDLVHGCTFNDDLPEAHYWVNYFNMYDMDLPPLLQDFIQNSTTADNNKKRDESPSASAEQFHRLPHDKVTIVLIDTKEKYVNMLHHLAGQNLVAIDAEWKPISRGGTSDVALIQIATREQIYLIDVVLLNIVTNDWNQLVDHVFNNQQMVKIAFAPKTDLQMFQKLMPLLNLSPQMLHSYLDLQGLWKQLLRIAQFKFPYQSDDNNVGQSLGDLVQLCLGKKLDKSNQFSNWENRPLRQEQLVYAALDAYCLIEMYDIIKRQCDQTEINFNDLINTFMNKMRT